HGRGTGWSRSVVLVIRSGSRVDADRLGPAWYADDWSGARDVDGADDDTERRRRGRPLGATVGEHEHDVVPWMSFSGLSDPNAHVGTTATADLVELRVRGTPKASMGIGIHVDKVDDCIQGATDVDDDAARERDGLVAHGAARVAYDTDPRLWLTHRRK